MTTIGCTHRKVTTYSFVGSNAPAGLWACADCGHKFVRLDVRMEVDAERYRWLRANGEPAAGMEYRPDWTPEMYDATIDAAMVAG